ncbi:hypothetical protein QZH41_012803 [Actinostola sp. cb2023]|nr:hypothetical protein QZH41_012803 [Actinostola sp. cb2023]
MEDIVLSDTDLDPTEEQKVMFFLADKAEDEHTEKTDDNPINPLSDLDIYPIEYPVGSSSISVIQVDYSGGFNSFSTQRFGQQFVDRVANPKDILLFYRKKEVKKKDSHIRPDVDDRMLHLHPDALDNIRMEDLIKDYLTSNDNALQLSILTETRMAQALREFVDKDENEAISTLVHWQLNQTQKHLKHRNDLKGDEIEIEAKKFVDRRREREEQRNEDDEEEVRKVTFLTL